MKVYLAFTDNTEPTVLAGRIRSLGHTVFIHERFNEADVAVLYPDIRESSDFQKLLDQVFSNFKSRPIPMLFVRCVTDRGAEFARMHTIMGMLDETCSDELLQQKLEETVRLVS